MEDGSKQQIKLKKHTRTQKEYPAIIAKGMLVTKIIANVGENISSD